MPAYKGVWFWEEAFDKFGFGDGDGLVFTDTVAEFIETLGYAVEHQTWWACHNEVIGSIKKPDGEELIPEGASGYYDPRTYLPGDLVAALDEEFDGKPGDWCNLDPWEEELNA